MEKDKTNQGNQRLTFENGAPVPNHHNVMTAGPRGPMVLQDLWFMEKMAHFDREVIPERRMHAKGSGAFGTFTVTHDVTEYSRAALFNKIGKKTDVFLRFSTVAGERGAADAERDIRGFAVKFYTEEGNWDLVGNNTPVFFIRDPLHFPDLNHAVKRDPRTNMRSAQNNWDYWTSLPESLHQITIVMGDRGLPIGYRHMHGFGSHTFALINSKNERVWCKFHFKSHQPLTHWTDEEGNKVIANDRESSQKDLYEAIERGEFPKWDLKIQVMTEEQAKNHKDNPFDITKVWSQKEYPLIPVGTLELNKNPDNYHAQVEQAAFTPASLVPGISVSPDKLLQGRLFSYGDAHRYRLTVNYHQIPVNQPKVPVSSYHRDGLMRIDGNYGSTTSYFPNSYGVWEDQPEYQEPPLPLDGDLRHYDKYDGDNWWYQPGDLYRLMKSDEQERLIKTTAANIAPVTNNIKYRHASHCYIADTTYGERIAAALGLNLDRVKELAALGTDNEGIKKRLHATSAAVWKD